MKHTTMINPSIARRTALRTALLYATVAGLWILLSDLAVNNLSSDAHVLGELQTWKGWFFVGVTATLLFLLVHRDMLRLFTAYRQTEASKALYQSLVDVLPQCLYRVDRDGRFTFLNAATLRLLQMPLEECLQHTTYSLLPLRFREQHQRDDQRVLAGETRHFVESVQFPGQPREQYIEIVKSPLYGPDGLIIGIQGIFWDITEHREAASRVEYLANHDALTGLPNRLLLHDRFQQARAQAARDKRSVALLFLDVDRLKDINETFGHPVGDRLLVALIERIRQHLRSTDTLSRYGGDAFAAILGNLAGHHEAAHIAEKMLACTDEPFTIDGNNLPITFSIGIAVCPADSEEFDTLMQEAETAMYQVKEDGRNGYRFFTTPMNAGIRDRLAIQHRLLPAFRENRLELFFQPQYDLQNGRLIGAEALLRWHDEERGWIPPAQFIPIAEDTGLIVAIGAWVIEQTCQQINAWRTHGEPPSIAVNLSSLQLRRGDLVATVARALERYQLPGHLLELEMTESMLVQDNENTATALRSFKDLGIRLAIDDFGTGYSNLGYLKRFAFDTLKIDQSFVRDMATNADSAAIVHTIIMMADNLKLTTLAEGVETAEQAEALRQLGCGRVQGYYFGRPMPAQDFAALLQAPQTIQ